MEKMNWKRIMGTSVACGLSLSLLAGCSSSRGNVPSVKEKGGITASAVGAVLLSINPEIEISYDDNGLVMDVAGVNDDGKNVVSNFDNYVGDTCDEVIHELVQKIYEDGYFENTIAGNSKNIVIKLEEGSAYPSDKFLEEIAEGAKEAVNKYGINSSAMTIKEEDMTGDGYIGLEKAKELVLAQLGLDEASFVEKDYKLKDGVYELEFISGGIEYEYEVHAVTGKVLEADHEKNDDWNEVDEADDQDDDTDDQDDDTDDQDDGTDDQDDDTDDQDDEADDQDDDTDDQDDEADDQDDDTDDQDDDTDDQDDDTDDQNDDTDDQDDDTDDQDDDTDDQDDGTDDQDDDTDDQDDDTDDQDDDTDDQDDDTDDQDDDTDDQDDDND